MAMWSDPQSRLDLHNISINFGVASRGRCGFIHLDSGRVRQLPHRHRGPCDRGLNRLAKCVEESVVSSGDLIRNA